MGGNVNLARKGSQCGVMKTDMGEKAEFIMFFGSVIRNQ
jgi:hypothetical protein